MQLNTERIVNFAAKLPNGTAPNSRTELRQNGGRSAKNQSELPQKAKVKCHKKPNEYLPNNQM